MKKCSIERGVHTLELYLGQLSYADVDAITTASVFIGVNWSTETPSHSAY